MIVISIIFIILCLFSIRVKEKIVGNRLYLDGYNIKNTNAIKGILAVSIILSHITGRVNYTLPYINFSVMGSIGVGCFFFLSGYALVVSLRKRENYMEGFVSKRFTKILIPYLLMLICYIIVICVIGKTAFTDVVISFVKGYPISNSWYVLASMYCYFLFWVAFAKDKEMKRFSRGMAIILIELVLYTIVVVGVFHWADWWYKTIICFPLGLYWGYSKEKIEKFLQNNYIKTLCVACIFFSIAYLFPGILRRIFNICGGDYIWLINDFLMGVSGTLLIGILLYKISLSN